MATTRSIIGAALAGALVALASAAAAASLIQQSGDKNPTLNGFTVDTCCGSGATGAPIKKDEGKAVWSMGGGNVSDQFAYVHALSSAQMTKIATDGFVLTAVARVLPGSGQAYTADVPVTFSGAFLDGTTVRWEFDLGLDANGDPVVVLPTTVDDAGPGGAIQSHGVAYVLTGRGDTYNKYQLVVNSGAADLYVNGVKVLAAYTGETAYVGDRGIVFSVTSGGRANFNLVSLTAPAKAPSDPVHPRGYSCEPTLGVADLRPGKC